MLLIPAIDLCAGRCVRLRQGDFGQQTTYSDDPVAVARRWVELGAPALHLVDLDGAVAGKPMQGDLVARIVQAVDVPCQVGGGLRSDADVETAFKWGVARVIVGTKALADPAWLSRLAQQHPARILLGLDLREGKLATSGWQQETPGSAEELLPRLTDVPLAGIIATDISRDGTLAGPNIDLYRGLSKLTALPLFASGGIGRLADLDALLELPLAGCILGKSLYEGTLDLPAALAVVRELVA